MVKKGEDRSITRQYAKNLLMAQQIRDRIMVNKTRIEDVKFSIDEIFMNARMTSVMGDTSNLMKKVNGLCNVQEISQTMGELSTNLEKMGVITEMVGDAMDEVGDADIDEDSPDVNNLIDELEGKVASKNTAKGTALTNQQKENADEFDSQLASLKI